MLIHHVVLHTPQRRSLPWLGLGTAAEDGLDGLDGFVWQSASSAWRTLEKA
jgi:hypothetical protein